DPEDLSRGLEYAAGHVARARAGEPGDDRRDPARMKSRLLFVRAASHPEVFGKPRERAGCDRVDGDAVAAELARGDDRERRDAGLGGAVVGLPGVAVDARNGRRVDETSIDALTLLRAIAPIRGSVVRGREGPLQVDFDDG